MSLIAVIPAHLNSVRFYRKILVDIHGLPMIEHVRRRALLSDSHSEVNVATCDNEIKDTVEKYGGKVIMTSKNHLNGTSRVTEAVSNINTDLVMLLQGDEPLILPRQIDVFINEIKRNLKYDAWNATADLKEKRDLFRESIVKCEVSEDKKIKNFFRNSLYKDSFHHQKVYIKKILGLMTFKKTCLSKLQKINPSRREFNESIEQLRIIENNFSLKSVKIDKPTLSINEPHELKIVLSELSASKEQLEILTIIKNE